MAILPAMSYCVPDLMVVHDHREGGSVTPASGGGILLPH